MKKYQLIALALALAGTAFQASAQETAGLSERDVATLKADTQQFVEAVLVRDWDRVGKLYATDAVLMLPNQPAIVGRDAIMQQWTQTPVSAMTVTPLEIGGSGGIAFIRGAYTMELTFEGQPEPVSDKGKYVVILRRQSDGSWPAVIDMLNSDLPLP